MVFGWIIKKCKGQRNEEASLPIEMKDLRNNTIPITTMTRRVRSYGETRFLKDMIGLVLFCCGAFLSWLAVEIFREDWETFLAGFPEEPYKREAVLRALGLPSPDRFYLVMYGQIACEIGLTIFASYLIGLAFLTMVHKVYGVSEFDLLLLGGLLFVIGVVNLIFLVGWGYFHEIIKAYFPEDPHCRPCHIVLKSAGGEKTL